MIEIKQFNISNAHIFEINSEKSWNNFYSYY